MLILNNNWVPALEKVERNIQIIALPRKLVPQNLRIGEFSRCR